MPSDRAQLNFRPDPDTYALWESLRPRLSAALGVELSQAQLFTLAVRALAEKHPAPAGAEPPPPAPVKGRRKRSG